MRVPVVVVTAYAPCADSLPVEPDLLLLKPVDINQLSGPVQRLQATQVALDEPAHDFVTGLYTLPFFNVRMTFHWSVKPAPFGALAFSFADVSQMNELRDRERDRGAKFSAKPCGSIPYYASSYGYHGMVVRYEHVPYPDRGYSRLRRRQVAGRLRDSMKAFSQAMIAVWGCVRMLACCCAIQTTSISLILRDLDLAVLAFARRVVH
ncbi:MAG: hypothetical protein IPP55_18335 [Anaerolineales bacterium]|nr:hypothetical protein [Anaerolineales bacterium]